MAYLFFLVQFLVLGTIQGQSQEQEQGQSNYLYTEYYFEVPLDHFTFTHPETFNIRYLVNDTWWSKDKNGPIFFYTGNEGSIDAFATNTGFMWDIASQFGAALIFAEHRFYGLSSPPSSLGRKLGLSSNQMMGFLSVSQVLADYAQLISWFKEDKQALQSPVIAFGGSYGGLLTTWLRMKYPHIIIGGIAASAPFYLQSVPCETFDASLKSIFSQEGNPNCVNVIRKSWSYLNHLGKSKKGRKWLSEKWDLCSPMDSEEDMDTLKSWLESMYGTLGMVNYPYPANFLQDLPANPVKTFCSFLEKTDILNEKQVILNLFQAISIYMNYTGSLDCFDYSDDATYTPSYSANDDATFNYQSCTELIDPTCDDGIHDFYEPQNWNFIQFSDDCYQTYKVRPNPNLTDLFFGGKDIIAGSNIVFSNGQLDPWYYYGVLGNMSESLIAITIPEAAHHLDLRGANPADPQSVKEAREIEKYYIRKWIKEYYQERRQIDNAFESF